MTKPTDKLCNRCAHAYRSLRNGWLCGYHADRSPINGRPTSGVDCTDTRSAAGFCGPEGRCWLDRIAARSGSNQAASDFAEAVDQRVGLRIDGSGTHELTHQIGVILGIAIAELTINLIDRLAEKTPSGLAGLPVDPLVD